MVRKLLAPTEPSIWEHPTTNYFIFRVFMLSTLKGLLNGSNFPNPFIKTTNIQFTLPAGGNANIKVYNILGEQVAEILNSYMSAGTHSIQFDASGLNLQNNSNLFIYKIESNGMVETKTMIQQKQQKQ